MDVGPSTSLSSSRHPALASPPHKRLQFSDSVHYFSDNSSDDSLDVGGKETSTATEKRPKPNVSEKLMNYSGRSQGNIQTLLNSQPRKLRSFLSPVQAVRNKDNKLNPNGDTDITSLQIHQLLLQMQNSHTFTAQQPQAQPEHPARPQPREHIHVQQQQPQQQLQQPQQPQQPQQLPQEPQRAQQSEQLPPLQQAQQTQRMHGPQQLEHQQPESQQPPQHSSHNETSSMSEDRPLSDEQVDKDLSISAQSTCPSSSLPVLHPLTQPLQRYQEQHKLAMHQASLVSRSQELRQLPKASLQPKLPDCILQIQHRASPVEDDELPRPLPHPLAPPQPPTQSLPLDSPQPAPASHESVPHRHASPHVRFQDQPAVELTPRAEPNPITQKYPNPNISHPPVQPPPQSQHKQHQITSVNPLQPLPPPKLQQPAYQQQLLQPQQSRESIQQNDFQQRRFEQQFQMQLDKHQHINTSVIQSQPHHSFSASHSQQNRNSPPLFQSHNLFSASLPLPQPSKPTELPRKSLTDTLPPHPTLPTPPRTSDYPQVQLFPPSLSRQSHLLTTSRSSLSTSFPPAHPRAISPRKQVGNLDLYLVPSNRDARVQERPTDGKDPPHTLASLAADQMKGMTRIMQLMRMFHFKRIFTLYRRAQELRAQYERQGALHDKYTILPASNYPPISRISEKWDEVQRYPFLGKVKKQREFIAGATMKKNSYNKGSHERDAMVSNIDFTKSHSDELVRDGVRQWEGTQFKASLVNSLYEKYMKKIVILSLRLATQRSKLRDHILSWQNSDGRDALVREAFRGWLSLCPCVPIFGELKLHLTRFKRMWWFQKWKDYASNQRATHRSADAAVRHALRVRKLGLFARWRGWTAAQRVKGDKLDVARKLSRFAAVRRCFRRWVGFANQSMSLKSKLLSIAFGERSIPRKITLAATSSPSLQSLLSRRSLQDISHISPGPHSRALDPSRSTLFSSPPTTPPSSSSNHLPIASTPTAPHSSPTSRSPQHLGFTTRIAPVRVPFSCIPQRLALVRNPRYLAHSDLLSALTRSSAQRQGTRADRNEADADHAGEADNASLVKRAQRRAALGKAWVTWCRAMYWKYCEEMGGIFREVSVLMKCMVVWKRHADDQKRKATIANAFHRTKMLATCIRIWRRGARQSLAVWKHGLILRWRKFVEISKARRHRFHLAQDFARIVSLQNVIKSWQNFVGLRKKQKLDLSKLDSFCESRGISVHLRSCWERWTKKLHARQLLRCVISRAAQKWKERMSSHSKYLQQYNTAQEVFSAWQDLTRARVLKRKLHAMSVAASAFYKRKLIKTPFRLWLQWWRQKKRVYDCGLKVRANHNRFLERSTFRVWHGGDCNIDSSLQRFQTHWRHTRPMYIAFTEWRAFVYQRKPIKVKLSCFCTKFAASKTFQMWQVYVYRSSCRLAAREARSEFHFRKLSSLFLRWRSRMHAKLDDVMDEMILKMEARELQFRRKRELANLRSDSEADTYKKTEQRHESTSESSFMNYFSEVANATFDREVQSIFRGSPPHTRTLPTKLADRPRVPLATFLSQAPAQNLALATVRAQFPARATHGTALDVHARTAHQSRKKQSARLVEQVCSPARARTSSARSPSRDPARLVRDPAQHARKHAKYTHTHKSARTNSRTPPRKHSSVSPARTQATRDADRAGAGEDLDISAIMRAELARQEEVKRRRDEVKRRQREEKEDAEERREERERKEVDLMREIERLRAEALVRKQERMKEDRAEALKNIEAREIREEEDRDEAERDKQNETKLQAFLAHKRHLAHEEDARSRVHSLRGLSLHELFVLMKCTHALKVYTRNKRIKRVLQRKVKAVYERNVLLRAMNAWSARTVRVDTHALRVEDGEGTQFVRLKGNLGQWQRALRTPLRSVPALALPELRAQDLAFRDYDLAVDHDNRLYRRVGAINSRQT